MSQRAPSINSTYISGNLVRDPEVRQIGTNKTSVCTVTVANNHGYMDKENQWQEITTYVDVELWGKLAQRVENYCQKGSPIIVQGQLRQINWTDKESKKHTKLQIRGDKLHILSYPEKS